MKILDDIKLDFSDVLLLPKRNQYSSRAQVTLERTLKFKYSKYSWTGIPIMISNMDTTGTIKMAQELQNHKVITCLHKYYKWSDKPCSNKKQPVTEVPTISTSTSTSTSYYPGSRSNANQYH